MTQILSNQLIYKQLVEQCGIVKAEYTLVKVCEKFSLFTINWYHWFWNIKYNIIQSEVVIKDIISLELSLS